MPQSIATKMALTAGSGSNLIAQTVTAIALNEQLNANHEYLYLQLPLWFFFLMTVILSFVGAMSSLLTDTMQATITDKIKSLFLGFTIGLIGAFVILPLATTKPNVILMMFTALALSFSGTVLLHNLNDLLRSNDAKDGIKSAYKDIGGAIKDYLVGIVKAMLGGRK